MARGFYFMNIENTPLISIIIPIYNVESYLATCLNSVINQTYKHLEIILVDDGSTDGCGEICDDYAKCDTRIKVLHKENGGLSDARNAGMAVAQGCFIGFVDGDDWIELDMYEVLYQAIRDNHADVAICGYYEQIGDRIIDEYATGEVLLYSGKEIVRKLLLNDTSYQICIAVWNRLYKRELIQDIQFPFGKLYEDIVYSTEVLLKCDTCVYVDKKKYHYLLGREGSIIASGFRIQRLTDEIYLKQKRTEFLLDHGEVQLAKLSHEIMVHDMLLYYGIMCKNKATYREYIKEYKYKLRKMKVDNKWSKTGMALVVFKISPKIWEMIIHIKRRKIDK